MDTTRGMSRLLWGLCGVAFVLLSACDSPNHPNLRIPTEMQLVRGDTQRAVVGEVLADSLEVRVLNRRRQPVAGVEVEWIATSGGGTLSPGTAQTDAQGRARAAWTLGLGAGEQTAEARLPGRQVAAVAFTARAAAGAPEELLQVSGDNQTGTVGEPLPEPLVVQVTDYYGNPIEGVAVTWSTSAGQLTPESAHTDASGLARARWTLSTRSGSQGGVMVRIEGAAVIFNAVAEAGPVVGIELFPPTLAVLHPARVRLAAMAWDVYENHARLAPFVWTSSNPAVAGVEPEPDTSSTAILSSRAVGNLLVSASSGGVTESMPIRVTAVEGPFSTANTGLSLAFAVNDRGEVVGPIGNEGVALWRNGQTEHLTFPHPGYHGTQTAEGINNLGAILVFQRLAGNTGRRGAGFSSILKDGLLTPISNRQARGLDINDSDAAVGVFLLGFQYDPMVGVIWDYRAFLWAEGQLTELDHVSVPGGQTYAVAVNNRTQVAVNMTLSGGPGANDPQVSAAYLWEAGQYTAIPRPDPACLGWVATDLNDLGHVLLNCGIGRSRTAAFLWDKTTMTSLAPLTYASSLNNRGEAVGWDQNGLHLWRNGGAIRLVDLVAPVAPPIARVRINNVGQILLDTHRGVYLLTPVP